MSSKKLFNYFSVRELVRTVLQDDLFVCCSCGYMDNLLNLLVILDGFREFVGCPIYITSSYRNKHYNEQVGGSSTSQHLVGEAVDFVVSGMFFDAVRLSFIDFVNKYHKNDVGQVIFYVDKCFIHLALPNTNFKSFTYYDKRKNQDNH